MDKEAMVEEMMRLLESQKVKVVVRNLDDSAMPVQSGLIRLHGEAVLYIHSRLRPEERIELLVSVLRQFDFLDVYVSPALREMLEKDERGNK